MSTLKVNSIIPVAGVPTGGGGGIIQIVKAVTTTQTSTSSESFVDTNLTATITPTSTSSHVLILARIICEGTQNNSFARFDVFRGGTSGTQLGNSVRGLSQMGVNNGNDFMGSCNIIHLDTGVSTTSATEYLIKMRLSGSGTVKMPGGGTSSGVIPCEICLLEVSA